MNEILTLTFFIPARCFVNEQREHPWVKLFRPWFEPRIKAALKKERAGVCKTVFAIEERFVLE